VPLYIVVGGFFGDEGKGKIAAFLAHAYRPAASVRTGATNAGHTVVYRSRRYRLRAVPAALVSPETQLYIARGALVDVEVFLGEVSSYNLYGRVWLDYQTGIITREHVEREKLNSQLKDIGSTLTGVGAAQADRVLRTLRLARDYPELAMFTRDTQAEILELLERGELVTVEASQGYWLSLYHGTYPYVTSRDTTATAASSEIGIGPSLVDHVVEQAEAG